MEKFKSLNRYQKGILILMLTMTLIFAVLYFITISRVGYEYEKAILVPRIENGNHVYSGKIHWKDAVFTVYPDKTVVFQYDDKTYGPYTVKEDPTAIPDEYKDDKLVTKDGKPITGLELRCKEEILFRGIIRDYGNLFMLVNEDGSTNLLSITYSTSLGVMMDENGEMIDPMEPSASTILELMHDPELTHNGDWMAWFTGVFICIVTAISILFADELFRWNLSFLIRNADRAEPSDWEIAERYIVWTILPITVIAIYVIGLM